MFSIIYIFVYIMFQYIQEKYNYYINLFFKKEESLIMINNNIYNLSSYKHPGGSIILDAINNDKVPKTFVFKKSVGSSIDRST